MSELESTSTASSPTGKRNNSLGWEEYFMGLAFLTGMRSKDPNTQVGACIVNKNKRIVGLGFNGMPDGCHDDEYPWSKNSDSPYDCKHTYVCHAEMNAIVNTLTKDFRDCTMYVGLFPCCECAKIIIQSGIKDIVYVSDKDKKSVDKKKKRKNKAVKRMFASAKTTCRRYKPKIPKLVVDFNVIGRNVSERE